MFTFRFSPFSLASLLKSTLIISTLLPLTNCGGGGGGGDSSGGSSTAVDYEATTTSDVTGLAAFTFPVAAGKTGVQLSVNSTAGVIRMISLVNPSGNVVADSNTIPVLAPSITPQYSPNITNLPLLLEPLQSGGYNVRYRIQDTSGNPILGAKVTLKVIAKSDSTPTNGTLKINMVLVGPVSGSPDITSDFEWIVNVWQQIYARAGITLDVQWFDYAGPSNLPNPYIGAQLYQDISTVLRKDALNVVIGSTVSGLSSPNFIFGIYGSLPGPVLPSPRSAIVLSYLQLTGPDGRFDYFGPNSTQTYNDEKRIAAEELAQLAAHYLGLHHTNEFNNGGIRVTSVDLLSDTQTCTTLTDCRVGNLTRSNTLFPFPLQKLTQDQGQFRNNNNNLREYYARDAITDQQRAVMNLPPLVQ